MIGKDICGSFEEIIDRRGNVIHRFCFKAYTCEEHPFPRIYSKDGKYEWK